jgi:hypothetical protein
LVDTMSKKRLGNDPLDELDILKGPDRRAGNMTSSKAGNTTSQMSSHVAGSKTSYIAGNMTGDIAGNMTSHSAIKLDIPAKSKLRKMTYYFREDQLKELDKLSKKTGRDRSELARMAIDLLIGSVQAK